MQLARALRQSPALQVELYLPSSSEELLQRFNGMLERLPINAARSRLNLDQRLRLWVLHMTTREELAEVLSFRRARHTASFDPHRFPEVREAREGFVSLGEAVE